VTGSRAFATQGKTSFATFTAGARQHGVPLSLHNAKTKKLLKDLRVAFDHLEKGHSQEAYDLTLAVQAAAEGMTSPLLKWMLAAAADQAGDVLGAARFIEEAVALDPLSVPAARSVAIIQGHLREALLDRDVPEEKVQPIYTALLRLGEVDAEAHVAYARHLSTVGEVTEAMEVLTALSTLSPNELPDEAWVLVTEVAEKLGKTGLAVEARMKALMARCSGRVRFNTQAAAKA
jgi:tetratricopeptide (TPR) repeat protein